MVSQITNTRVQGAFSSYNNRLCLSTHVLWLSVEFRILGDSRRNARNTITFRAPQPCEYPYSIFSNDRYGFCILKQKELGQNTF